MHGQSRRCCGRRRWPLDGGVCGGDSLLLFGHPVRTRCGVSSVFVAGSSFAVEAWDFFSALGCAGALRLRRAPVSILSSGLVDAGRGPERDFSLDARVRHLYLDCAGGGRRVDVLTGPAMGDEESFCRHDAIFVAGALYGQSISSADCLLAQCVRRTAGELPGAAAAACSCCRRWMRIRRSLRSGAQDSARWFRSASCWPRPG